MSIWIILKSFETPNKKETLEREKKQKNNTNHICLRLCCQQRWGGPDRRVHHPQHSAGADEVRGGGGHLPDGQDAAHPETRHRPDRGE